MSEDEAEIFNCSECGEGWDDEDEANSCCHCSCGCMDENEGTEEGNMGTSEQAPWIERGKEFSSTSNANSLDKAIEQWDLKKRPDPTTNAADFYILEIITNDLYKASNGVSFISPETVFNMRSMFGMTEGQMLAEAMNMNLSNFQLFMYDAAVEAVNQIEKLDTDFLAYCQMAIGGELRHHKAVGGKVIDPPSRRSAAWFAWKDAVEAIGPDIFLDAAALFREFTGGSYGGEKWALPCEIVHMRLTGTLGPNAFFNRKLFVDRVWTLEHNGGCFLNKIDWPNKGISGIKTVLNAHAAQPENIQVLWANASKDVQKLLVKYIEFVQETNPEFEIPFDIHMANKTFQSCKGCGVGKGFGHAFGCNYIRTDTAPSFYKVQGSEIVAGSIGVKKLNKILGKSGPYFYDDEGNINKPDIMITMTVNTHVGKNYEWNKTATHEFVNFPLSELNKVLATQKYEGQISKQYIEDCDTMSIDIYLYSPDGSYYLYEELNNKGKPALVTPADAITLMEQKVA